MHSPPTVTRLPSPASLLLPLTPPPASSPVSQTSTYRPAGRGAVEYVRDALFVEPCLISGVIFVPNVKRRRSSTRGLVPKCLEIDDLNRIDGEDAHPHHRVGRGKGREEEKKLGGERGGE